MFEIRLGDTVDDHCSRCGRLTDHSVVALVGEAVKKVRCRTCQHEHEYRYGKGRVKKTGKQSAYEQVLASITAQFPSQPTAVPGPDTKRRPARRGGQPSRPR